MAVAAYAPAGYWRFVQALMVLATVGCALALGLLGLSIGRQLLAGSAAVPWPELFGGAMATVCLAVFAWLFVFAGGIVRRATIAAARRAEFPGEPWRWTRDWDRGHVRSRSPWASAMAVGAFVVVWTAAVAGIGLFLQATAGLFHEPAVGVGVVVAGISGLLLIPLAVRQLRLAMTYRPAAFDMSTMPGVIGGLLAGIVQLPANVPRGGHAFVALRCWKHLPGGRNSSGRTICLWQDEMRVPIPPSGPVPVSITIPYGLPDSDLPLKSGPTIRWKLEVSVDEGSYSTVFQVPVFKTEASDASVRAGVLDSSQPLPQPPGAKSRVLPSHAAGAAVALGGYGGMAGGLATVAMAPALGWAVGRYLLGDPAWAETLLRWGAFAGGVILVLMVVSILLTAHRIDVDSRAVRISHGRGPLSWTRTIPIHEIAEFRFDPAATSELARVEACLKDGKTYWVSGNLSGLEEAKWLVFELTRLVERYRDAPGVRAAP
jgi:hypothetical protein